MESRVKDIYRKRGYQSLFYIAVLALLLALEFIPGPADKVVFLNVGQGDATLFQSGTQQVLIDGGPGMKVLQRLGEELPWFDRTIEVVILTHPQRDHIEGLLHVLERYDVDLVLLPKAAHTSQLQEVWLQKIQDLNIPYRFAWAGQRLTVGDMSLHILGPGNTPAARAAIRADLNNASVITRVDFSPTKVSAGDRGAGDLSFLLTGDAEKRVEAMLVAEYGSGSGAQSPKNGETARLDVDVLKAGHHGSNSSTHKQLLQTASPSAAVISVGADNKFGHPHEDVLARLGDMPIFRTDEQGSVGFIWTGREWVMAGQY